MVRALATAAAGILLIGVTGCTPVGGTAAATSTVTVITTETTTVTVTSPPTALPPPITEPSASDPISRLQAWAICRTQPEPELDPGFWAPLEYNPSLVTGSSGSWTVALGWNAVKSQAGALVSCTVTGTLGEPTVSLTDPIDT